ncbi:hypothetical protein B0T21DRAFT_338724 [Apiosordaria backusii]|uniref:Uncharacterized protein n=1 Tax=Apiosordaria backusii TaxID=314023 RepID=A0AA40AN17_9PEZI|nr:hypothetical protein B0T21DRAFT_338724 [Apiosordaria backusii]
MLLTSSQVSIAVSSSIVFFFTLALFLSGYAIQQRTLRDIRASINRPKPSPKIFLPDRFKQSTTELEDGTIVIVEDENISRPPRPEREVVITVVPTVPTEEEVLAEEKGKAGKGGRGRGVEGEGEEDGMQKPVSRAERRRRIKEELMRMAQGEERGWYQRRLY